MRPLLVTVLALLAFDLAAHQTCDFDSIAKQQSQIAQKVVILRLNFTTFWSLAFPNGTNFPSRNNEADRIAAWNPKLTDAQKSAVSLNDGLGCVVFLVKQGLPQLPKLCAPPDVQARLAMEALREDWENGKAAPKGSLLEGITHDIPMTWAEEKTIYCILRPEADYIDLSDKLQSCTRKKLQD